MGLGYWVESANLATTNIDHLPRIVHGCQQVNEPPPSVNQNIRHETINVRYQISRT